MYFYFWLPYHMGCIYFSIYFLSDRFNCSYLWGPLARRIITAVMIPALAISYLISTLFFQRSWQGFASLNDFNIMVARIATASFMAYVLGQLWMFLSLIV
nr:queuosine precursor transporter [Proteus mirabilis]